MEEDILNILRNFGWSEGFRIPVANEENRILELKVEEAVRKKHEVESMLHNTKSDLIAIKQYYDSIVEQRFQNEQMLVDYQKQIEDEERSLFELRYQKDSLTRDTKQLKRERNALQDENEELRTDFDAAVKECENLQKDIDWSREMEELLDENIDQENSIINMIDQFNVQDRTKFEQTEVKRIRLIEELSEYKNLLHQTDTEICSLNGEFDKLSKLFEEMRDERQWLVKQWENSVQTLRARDTEMEKVARELNILMEASRSVESKIMEYEGFYKELVRNNMLVEIEIRRILREMCNQQLANERLSRELEIKLGELTDRRNELVSLGAAVSEQRTKNTQLKREIMAKNELVERFKIDCQNSTQKLKDLESRSLSAVERKKQLEQIFQSEERRSQGILHDRQRLDRQLQEVKRKIAAVEDEYALACSETKQLRNVKLKLQKSLGDLGIDISKYEDSLSNIELKIEEVLSKTRFIKEEKSDELKEQMELQMTKLSDVFNDKQKTLSSVKLEVSKCLTQIKTLTKESNACMNQLNNLHKEKEMLQIQIETNEKHLHKTIEENREKEVTENMLRLRVDHLEKTLLKTGEVVLSLEKQQEELETLMRKRLYEIGTSTKTLKIRRKSLLAEISNLKRNIDQVNAHMSQFMKKYEIIMDNITKDENGEPLTIENYRVKLVKERFTLLERGDDLDERIRKTEKEIQALENTLALMDVCSKKCKESASSVDANSKEYREKKEVEQEYNRLLSIFRKHKRTLPKLTADIEALKTKLSELRAQDQRLQRINQEKTSELGQLEREVNEQYVKLKRVDNRIKSFKKTLKNKDQLRLFERDFLTKELRNVNKAALGYIADLVTKYPEVKANTTRYLSEKGIELRPAGTKEKFIHNVTPSSDISSQASAIDDSATSVTSASAMTPSGVKTFISFVDAGALFIKSSAPKI